MPEKYARDNDNIEAILADTREAHGRLGALIDVLSRAVVDLRAETKCQPPEEVSRDE